jgi:hypothetical protein
MEQAEFNCCRNTQGNDEYFGDNGKYRQYRFFYNGGFTVQSPIPIDNPQSAAIS